MRVLSDGPKGLKEQQNTSSIDWGAIADLVWRGMTVPAACMELGYEWPEVHRAMPTDVARYMVDVSMLANCREEYLSGD